MARTLGNDAALAATSGGGPTAAPSPALRATRPGWRDPRLWIGVAIVAACIVAGARLIGAADDTIPVWALKSDAGAGAVLGRADLEVHRVHFASAGDLDGYLPADAPLPDRLTLVRGVGRGELLPRSAVATAGAAGTVQLPLAVDPAQVPPDVTSGSVVDVYVVGDAAGREAETATTDAAGQGAAHGGTGGGQRAPAAATPALSAATVVAAPRADDVFGSGQTKRQLTLAVPEQRAQEFFALLGAQTDPTITVVLRPAG